MENFIFCVVFVKYILRFQIKASFLKLKLRLQPFKINQFWTLFLGLLLRLKFELCFSNRSFNCGKMKALISKGSPISESNFRIWVIIGNWEQSFEFNCFNKLETRLRFLKKSFNSRNQASNLNWNKNLKMKLRFRKRSFYSRNEDFSLSCYEKLEKKLQIWIILAS